MAMRVCPTKVRSYTHEVSLAWLLKNDLNKNNILNSHGLEIAHRTLVLHKEL